MRRSLHFVTGKGGVGKSTVTAALALDLAARGARVLAIELGEPAGLCRVLAITPPGPGTIVRVPAAPGLSLATFDGAAALGEYITRRMHLGRLGRRVMQHPLYRGFVAAAPGVRELLAVGKIRDELVLQHDGARPKWDAIVVDTGASGHAMEHLRMPGAAAATFGSGLVHREAAVNAELLQDGGRTAVHVVATPEELPLREAAQVIALLRGHPVPAAAAGLELRGTLDAGMLDQKQAWDAFIRRYAPDATVANALYGNRFYQALSTTFSGSQEYMAVEEMCRLSESGRYDLVVLDTPPSSHALDFLKAPDRLAPLLERGVVAALARPAAIAGTLGRFLLRHFEHATGAGTLRDLSAFCVAAEAMVDVAADRAKRATALLHGGRAAFVLVAGPRDLVLAETGVLAAQMADATAPLGAVVLNRAQPCWPARDDAVAAVLADLEAAGTGADDLAWLRAAWNDGRAAAAAEDVAVARFGDVLPRGVAVATIPEGDGNVHTLRALAAMAERL